MAGGTQVMRTAPSYFHTSVAEQHCCKRLLWAKTSAAGIDVEQAAGVPTAQWYSSSSLGDTNAHVIQTALLQAHAFGNIPAALSYWPSQACK